MEVGERERKRVKAEKLGETYLVVVSGESSIIVSFRAKGYTSDGMLTVCGCFLSALNDGIGVALYATVVRECFCQRHIIFVGDDRRELSRV